MNLSSVRYCLLLWTIIRMVLLLLPSVAAFSLAFGMPTTTTTTTTTTTVHPPFWNRDRQRYDTTTTTTTRSRNSRRSISNSIRRYGWVERNGEWEWEEDDPTYDDESLSTTTTALINNHNNNNNKVAPQTVVLPSATPTLPSQTYKPKQSLGQNYLKDPNTVAKIIRTFHQDMTKQLLDNNNNNHKSLLPPIVELGPGAGALTDKLVETYGADKLQCIEIDQRSVQLLQDKHGPSLHIRHDDVLQINYSELAREQQQQQQSDTDHDHPRPLAVIGNLPYYITSQILFALADASHTGAVQSATVTMQWEVAQRMVAKTHTKDYGILSVVFQLYSTDVQCHFKIPPTVFYPQPKVDSALVGLQFVSPSQLRQRLAGVEPSHVRRVVTTAFRQRRKTVRNSLKKLCHEILGPTQTEHLWTRPIVPVPSTVRQQAQTRGDDTFAMTQELPMDWASKRPEELTAGQFVELTRQIFGPTNVDENDIDTLPLGTKVWRKLKHGTN